MLVNPAARTFSFSFAPGKTGQFSDGSGVAETQPVLQALFEEALSGVVPSSPWPEGVDAQSIMAELTGLFSPTVGTAHVAPNEI